MITSAWHALADPWAEPIMRHALLETIVEFDDGVMHKYLEGHELSEEEIRMVLRKATINGGVVPVLCGAAFKNKGVQVLLDAVVDYLPAPVDVAAIQGHLPQHDATHAERKAARTTSAGPRCSVNRSTRPSTSSPSFAPPASPCTR